MRNQATFEAHGVAIESRIDMSKVTKCWYKGCSSDNQIDTTLLFYKFPKDTER